GLGQLQFRSTAGVHMRLLAAVALVLLSATAGTRATAQQPLIPRALEEWQGWVLKGKEFHRCPFLAGSNIAAADSYRCVWPERPGGRLALGRQGTAAEPRRLDVQLYRLVEDDIPLRLVTRLRLRAAGDAREEQLARVLPAGFIPMSLQGALPARLEPDGRLRVQVRAGRFELILTARQAQASATLSSPGEPGLAR